MFLCSDCIAGGEYDILISHFISTGSIIHVSNTSGSLGNKVNIRKRNLISYNNHVIGNYKLRVHVQVHLQATCTKLCMHVLTRTLARSMSVVSISCNTARSYNKLHSLGRQYGSSLTLYCPSLCSGQYCHPCLSNVT